MSNGIERSTAVLAGAVSRLRTVCELGRGSAAPWKNSQDLHSAILSKKRGRCRSSDVSIQ